MDLSNRFIGAMTEAPGIGADVDLHQSLMRELAIERAEKQRLAEQLTRAILTISRQQQDLRDLRRGKRERVRPQI